MTTQTSGRPDLTDIQFLAYIRNKGQHNHQVWMGSACFRRLMRLALKGCRGVDKPENWAPLKYGPLPPVPQNGRAHDSQD